MALVEVLAFDLHGHIAHFRRPDTTATHATYPFITRTAVRGVLGAVLGMNRFPDEDPEAAWTGIRLLAPVRVRAQELSLLGKGFLESGPSFNRPTSVELVVQPRYRIYYCGNLLASLSERLVQGQSVYPTYLGSAFALSFPRRVRVLSGSEYVPGGGEWLSSLTVLPTHTVDELGPEADHQIGRVGAAPYRALPERRFLGSVNLIYEVKGRPIKFMARAGRYDPPVRFVRVESDGDDRGLLCLW